MTNSGTEKHNAHSFDVDDDVESHGSSDVRLPIYTPSVSSEGTLDHEPLNDSTKQRPLDEAPPKYEEPSAATDTFDEKPNVRDHEFHSESVDEALVEAGLDSKASGSFEGKKSKHQGRARKALRLLLYTVFGILLIGAFIRRQFNQHVNHGSYTDNKPPVNKPNLSEGMDENSNRAIRIHETSQSVTGTFPLYDLLEIHTLSGSISVDIIPQAAGKNNKTGVIILQSQSGSIRANFGPRSFSDPLPSSFPKGRTYNTDIRSSSGGISSTLMHSEQTILETHSGSIQSTIYPLHPSSKSRLQTTAVSGSTQVYVKSLSPFGEDSLTGLEAHHDTRGSGSLQIYYPREWEGRVTASACGSGSVTLRGQGLDVHQEGRRYWVGERGDAENGSHVTLRESGSGSMSFNAA